MQGRQSCGLGGRDVPQGCGSWGVVGGVVHGRVWENTIAYFGLKVCWKVIIFHKNRTNLARM